MRASAVDPAEARKLGIEVVGDVPWGTHFCQFYQTKEDLIDILIPYFKAGLENNEFCMWVTAEPLEVVEAEKALRKAVKGFAKYVKKGQIEVISYKDWYVKDGKFDSDRVLAGWVSTLEKALEKGFSGLRLTGNTFWLERNGWKAFTDYEAEVNRVIGNYRMIAICTYCLDKCDANEVIDVVKNHQFAIIKRQGKWELIQSFENKRFSDELENSRKRLSSLYASMLEGVAVHDLVYDDSGRAVDYIVTDVNTSFETITGLARSQAIGKRASELFGTGEPPYLNIYARVASSGKPESFETYFAPMKKHFIISVFSPEKGRFNTVFHDITSRKTAEETLIESERRWSTTLMSIGDAVIATDPLGNVAFMNTVAENLTGWSLGDALQKPVKQVFNIVNAVTRQEVEDPVAKVLEKGLIVGLANHTILIRKDRSEVPIDDSGAPIRTEKGETLGVVLVFRDITERKKAEEQLRIASAFPEENPNPVLRVTREGKILFVNPAALRLLSVWGLQVGQKAPEKMLPIISNAFDTSLKKEFEENVEGRTFSFLVVPIANTSYVNIYGMDMTERKLAESKLAEQALMVASANDAIIGYDMDYRVRFWNKAAEKLYEYTADEAIGMVSNVLLKPTYTKTSREDLINRLKEVGHSEMESVRRAKDGKELQIESHVILLRDESGKPKGFVAVDRDITERKKTEETLRETRDYLDNLLNYANAPIIVWDPDFKITRFNHAFERLTGYKSTTVEGKKLDILFPEDEKKAAMEHIERTLRGEYWETVEIPILHVDGVVKTLLWNSANIHDRNGLVIATIAQGHDITERKQMQLKLEEYAKHLEDLVDEKTKQLQDAERLSAIGQTAAMIGHDIRNPLQVIVGSLDLMKMDLNPLPEGTEKQDMKTSLTEVEKQVNYINKIILDLQDFTKTMKPASEEFDLKNLIDELVSQMSIPSNIVLHIEVDETARRLKTDPIHVRRILGNLALNAIQAMPNGGQLYIRARRDGDNTIIAVEDTGAGIPTENWSKIFQPLFTTKSKGQGLGLAVVKRLTEAIGGTIAFTSEEDKGVKFTLLLPPLNRSNGPNDNHTKPL